MNKEYFDKAAGCLPDICFEKSPDIAIVLGSGWNDSLIVDKQLCRIPYQDIEGFGAAKVAGHTGEFMLYERHGLRVAAWCGRRHYYEGTGWEKVLFPVEMTRRMGCPRLLLTNAAGGINEKLRPGDFVIIRDHLNFTGANPLIGPHEPQWGERFPDMSKIYSQFFADILHAIANREGIRAMDGIYAWTTGPSYETPAEIRGYRLLGADVAGMSTVPEAIFAHACGIKTGALSLVSNLAAGVSNTALNHEEVIAAGAGALNNIRLLLDGLLSRLK